MRLVQPEFIIRQADKVAVENAKNRDLRADISNSSDAGRLYRQLMECAINERASDLQIIPLAENKAAIDMRVDGKNSRYAVIPKSTAETIRNILVNQAGIAGAMHPGKPIEGKMKYEKSDVRINMIPSKQGTDINIRFLSNHILTFDELGMSPEGIALFRRLINMTKGLVLIVGPTGSGKSTTMYAGLSEIVGNGRKICTVEDPVEIALPGATQIDVTANLSYEEAVKSILRHDVDIAVIGEIRDAAVADIVAREADTGHLILSTLHTNDAISAVSRLIHLGVDPYIIGDILAAVSAQRLVRRICPFCKTECSISELGENVVHTFSLSQSDAPFYKGKGCPHCKGSGYLGRIVINEILIADKQIRSAIQRKADRSEIESLALRNGFICMADDGIAKVRAGITTYEEILLLKNDII